MKKYLLSKVYAFLFSAATLFSQKNKQNKTANLNVSILYIVGLPLPCNSLLRCVRCVVKETAPKSRLKLSAREAIIDARNEQKRSGTKNYMYVDMIMISQILCCAFSGPAFYSAAF